MAGIDAHTGKVLNGLPHVEQSLEKLITTGLGQRVMREWVGNPGTKLLGENATPTIILRWITVIWSLVELFEPRFRIIRFEPRDVSRDGTLDHVMVGQYRPYAHLDWQQAQFFIAIRDGAVVLSPAT